MKKTLQEEKERFHQIVEATNMAYGFKPNEIKELDFGPKGMSRDEKGRAHWPEVPNDTDSNHTVTLNDLAVLKKINYSIPKQEVMDYFNQNDIEYIGMTDIEMYIKYMEDNNSNDNRHKEETMEQSVSGTKVKTDPLQFTDDKSLSNIKEEIESIFYHFFSGHDYLLEPKQGTHKDLVQIIKNCMMKCYINASDINFN